MTLVAGREFTDLDNRGLKNEIALHRRGRQRDVCRALLRRRQAPSAGIWASGRIPTRRRRSRSSASCGTRNTPASVKTRRPQIFFPYLQGNIEGLTAYIQTQGDPQSVIASLRREVQALDPNLALVGVTTLERLVERSVVNERLVATSVGGLERNGNAVVGDRPLRRHGLRRRAADARDWHPHGARRDRPTNRDRCPARGGTAGRARIGGRGPHRLVARPLYPGAAVTRSRPLTR